nr:GspL/Epsl periplasmic domain-containing protein [uncultured Desulfuromonas sp.]
MTKRRIGLEITSNCIRLAIFDGDRDKPVLLRKVERPLEPDTDLAEQVNRMLDGPAGFGDRFCTVLPGDAGFVRRLSFPFNDPRKINAAAAMELASQLPVDISNHIVTTTTIREDGEQFTTTAATYPSASIAAFLAPFDAGNLPIHLLGLTPFTEVNGLSAWLSQGVLVKAHDDTLTLSLVIDGQIVSHENCGRVQDSTQDLAKQIYREVGLLCRAERQPLQPLCLMGSNISTGLANELKGLSCEILSIPIEEAGQSVDPAFLPVCSMALAADGAVLNFRRGPFTLKSEWAALKKHFYIGGGLLAASLAILVASALHTYQFKTDTAEGYRKQLNQVFRETLPGQTAIVDPVKQLTAELNRVRQTGRVVGLDKSTSALAVLRDFSSHTPKDLTVDIKTFNYEPDNLTVEGITNSFDSVNRLAGELRNSPSFTAVRIADAKMGIEGKQVSFRLQITIGHAQGGAL